MAGPLRSALKKLLGRKRTADQSVVVHDPEVRETFLSDPDNTLLVSFPRTGSHWFRMIAELYFERPSLVRVFYYPNRTDYLMCHVHDLHLDIQVHPTIIYLYRDPVQTVYSYLSYEREPLDDVDRITETADRYGRHLDKWLYQGSRIRKKTVITYEGMTRDIVGEFGKICQHFDVPLDAKRLRAAASRVSKEKVSAKTPDDPKVVRLGSEYSQARETFCREHGGRVWNALLVDRERLAGLW